MSSTLYRKYRPKNFAEVIGQKHIVQTLSNAIKNNRVGQAYLFTGPRGTGKTSIARILAKTINCEKLDGVQTCETCPACKMINAGRTLDIIEIDAASNTGVDNIRELRETVALPPTALKYKVYIIDEVHMLSTGAFNALLKTLEEPPAHVIFILATTEIHKVPQTIISRCQRFDFARLPIQNIIEKLTLIAKNEKVNIDKDSLEMIAIAAEGGMRDAESLLGQIISLEDKNITLKEVEEILGTTDRQFAAEMAGMVLSNDSTGAIGKINQLLNDGYDLQVFNKSFINYLRQLMLIKIDPALKTYFSYEAPADALAKMETQAGRAELAQIVSAINLFLEAQNKISASMLPQLPLEIAIIKTTQTLPLAEVSTIKYQASNKAGQDTRNDDQKISNSKIQNSNQTQSPKKIELEEKNEKIKEPIHQAADLSIEDVKSKWNELLEEIKAHNHSLKALLSNCRVNEVKGNEITLATAYDFYAEKLNILANRTTIEAVFGKILGVKIKIKTVINKDVAKPAAEKDPEGTQDSLLNSAMKILGGKIVKE